MEISMRLKEKVVIITGGARGIGKCFALRFAREGAVIVAADVLDCAYTLEEIHEAGGDGLALKVDVSRETEVIRMTERVAERFGRIDILVNNASINGDHIRKPFHEISEEEWDRMMAVNVKGMFFCAKAVFPYMQKERKGKIINLCSTTIFKGVPNFLHYVSSKGAIAAFTRSLAREVGEYGINVNAIAPGFTVSEIFKDSDAEYKSSRATERAFKRDEAPEDIEGTAVFLASRDSDFITGQVIVVDGGGVMR